MSRISYGQSSCPKKAKDPATKSQSLIRHHTGLQSPLYGGHLGGLKPDAKERVGSRKILKNYK